VEGRSNSEKGVGIVGERGEREKGSEANGGPQCIFSGTEKGDAGGIESKSV